MPQGLQIWDKNRSGAMIVDLTTQFTNIIGYTDIAPIIVGGVYDFTTWQTISVPQFSLGVPFWFTILNWKQNHPEWNNDSLLDDLDVAPDSYVDGTTLYWRYTPLSNVPFGDQDTWRWGFHRIWYGVN